MKTNTFARLVVAVLFAHASAGIALAQPATSKPDLVNHQERPKLTRFDLDFAGGSPRDLVNAIQKATGRPLNVITREEDASASIPSLKLKNTTVVDLFGALRNIGHYTEKVRTGSDDFGKPVFSERQNSYQFVSRGGEPDDDSIWTFVSQVQNVSAGSPDSKSIRYYNLAPYLDTFKIDDITTAVKTGWEMYGEPTGAKFSFHKDTKLLIAVGRPDQLAVIDSVLKELAPRRGLPSSSTSQIIAARQTIGDLNSRLADLQKNYTANHPNVVAIKQQITELEQLIKRLSDAPEAAK